MLRYWSDTAGDWLDFVDSAMFPWVDIAVPANDTSRGEQAQLALAALRAANPGFDPLAGFDGAFVITHPGQMTAPNQWRAAGTAAHDRRRLRRRFHDRRWPPDVGHPGYAE